MMLARCVDDIVPVLISPTCCAKYVSSCPHALDEFAARLHSAKQHQKILTQFVSPSHIIIAQPVLKLLPRNHYAHRAFRSSAGLPRRTPSSGTAAVTCFPRIACTAPWFVHVVLADRRASLQTGHSASLRFMPPAVFPLSEYRDNLTVFAIAPAIQ